MCVFICVLCIVTWQGQLITFSGEKTRVQKDASRLGLDPKTWSLLIHSARPADTGIYSCTFNKQASDHNIVQLLVLGKEPSVRLKLAGPLR